MPNTVPLQFYNRYTGKLEDERIYGERWLRWAYGHPLGRLSVWAVGKRAWLSRWYGWRMNQPSTRRLIPEFINNYAVDPTEFSKSLPEFTDFNDFFMRQLKPEARPIAPGEGIAVFPADGRHLGFNNVEEAEGFYVKGEKFSLVRLFGEKLAKRYARGACIISRLCPVDYHRFHFPCDGTVFPTRELPGPLYSVHPFALRRAVDILATNKRTLTPLESPEFGTVAILEIGATMVGSIVQTYCDSGEDSFVLGVAKGQEKGYFAFGGSCTITLFEPGRIKLAADLVELSRNQIELYARMGDAMGESVTGS